MHRFRRSGTASSGLSEVPAGCGPKIPSSCPKIDIRCLSRCREGDFVRFASPFRRGPSIPYPSHTCIRPAQTRLLRRAPVSPAPHPHRTRPATPTEPLPNRPPRTVPRPAEGRTSGWARPALAPPQPRPGPRLRRDRCRTVPGSPGAPPTSPDAHLPPARKGFGGTSAKGAEPGTATPPTSHAHPRRHPADRVPPAPGPRRDRSARRRPPAPAVQRRNRPGNRVPPALEPHRNHTGTTP